MANQGIKLKMITEKRHKRKNRKPGTVVHVKSTDSDLQELWGMNGGQKAFWLRTHREDVLGYLESHDEDETRRHFGIAREYDFEALRKCWDFEAWHKVPTKLEKLETLIKIQQEDIIQQRKEIRELKQLFFTFRESVSDQLTAKFFLPLMKAAIRLEPELETPKEIINPLDVKRNLASGKN